MSAPAASSSAPASPRQQPEGGIVSFFHGGRDPLHRTHDDMLAYSLDRMEECHDYVQWLWPLHEPSAFAVVFPVLTRPQVAELSASAEARGRMLASLARFRLFYGLPAEAEGAAAAAVAAAAAPEGGGGGDAAPPAAAAAPPAPSSAPPAAGEAAIGALGEGGSAAASAAASAGNEGLPPGFSPARAALWAANGDHNLLRITRIIRSLRFLGLEAQSAAFYRDVVTVAAWAGLSRTTLAFWRKASEDDVWASMRR